MNDNDRSRHTYFGAMAALANGVELTHAVESAFDALPRPKAVTAKFKAKRALILEAVSAQIAIDAVVNGVRRAIEADCVHCQKYKAEYGPRHFASSRCESGGRAHCTCDVCF